MITKNIDPLKLEGWLIENKERVYKTIIDSCLDLLMSENSEEIFLSVTWEGKEYARVSILFSDLPEVIQKATNFFVENELYEEAAKAKKLLNLYDSKK